MTPREPKTVPIPHGSPAAPTSEDCAFETLDDDGLLYAEGLRTHHAIPLIHAAAAAEDRDVRLDVFLARHAGEGISRARVQQLIRGGFALVDGTVRTAPNSRLKGVETVELHGDEPACRTVPEAGPLCIMARDERIVVVDKPPGLTTHPAPSCPASTLVNRLLYHFPQLRDLAALDPLRPGIVHRLDKDTSGLLLVALDEAARLSLTQDFAARRVQKTYLALVHGVPANVSGDIRKPIGRHPSIKTRMAVVSESKGGRPAHSSWEVLWAAGNDAWPLRSISLFRVRIHTGRTHQIRVHLADMGHPIVGDTVYGPGPFAGWEKGRPHLLRLTRRQMLHAHSLTLAHPGGGQIAIRSMPPKDFRRLPLILPRRVQRVGLTGLPGSGKSLLLSLLNKTGVPIFSADDVVRELYAREGDGAHLLARRYGQRFLIASGSAAGSVDRRALFESMLNDDRLRREVEGFIHPLVRNRLEDFWKTQDSARLAVAEIPLLVEAGFENELDVVVGITLSEYTRQEWLSSKRGLTRLQATALDGWQWPEESKLARCHKVVSNPGTLAGLEPQAQKLLSWLRQRRVDSVKAQLATLTPLWSGDTPVEVLS